MKVNKLYIISSIIIIELIYLFFVFNYKDIKVEEYKNKINVLEKTIKELNNNKVDEKVNNKNIDVINNINVFLENYYNGGNRSMLEILEICKPIISNELYNKLLPKNNDNNIDDKISSNISISNMETYYNNDSLTSISLFDLNILINKKMVKTKKLIKLEIKKDDEKYLINNILLDKNL